MSARDKLRACFPGLPAGESNDLIEDAVAELIEAVAREVQVAGVREAAAILGVSRQRLHVTRRKAEFPAPHQVLASGPVWLVEDLETYNLLRNRVPGRRARERQ